MSHKKRKVSHECFHITDFCYRSSSKKVLSDLPVEILTEIFGYLTPQSLVQISNLKIQRLTEAACFKSADFSICNTITLKDVQSFFIKERLNLIQEINFNNVFFALPSTLTNCIVKCKSITKLYVFNCGLDYSHIGNIFNNCKALLECYWSAPPVDDCAMLQKPSGISNNLKKFYLQLQVGNNNPNLISFLNMCPDVEEVCINFSSCYITSVPADLSTRNFCVKTFLKTRNVAINIVLACQSPSRHKIQMFVPEMKIMKGLNKELIDIEDKPDFRAPHSAFLQLFDEKKLLDELPELPDESVNALVILSNDNFHHMAPHLDRIKRMTCKALNHFSLSRHEKALPDEIITPESGMKNHCVFSILSSIVESSVNITVLSLLELHTPWEFPLPTNISLKHLKVFNICACCLAVPDEECLRSEIHYRTGKTSFEHFVLNCTKVEKFGLFGCEMCRNGPTDVELIPISFWKLLKCLTIEHVLSLRQCWFLSQIATMCPELKMVELVQLSQPRVCHYIPSVVQILKKSKELVFLRINQCGFYPMDSLFWKAIESAQNLQGLCLKTSISTYIDNKLILEPLNKLPYIHLFHLVAKGTISSNLKSHVKRIMCEKGVKVPDIISTGDCSQPNKACSKRHFAMV